MAKRSEGGSENAALFLPVLSAMLVTSDRQDAILRSRKPPAIRNQQEGQSDQKDYVVAGGSNCAAAASSIRPQGPFEC